MFVNDELKILLDKSIVYQIISLVLGLLIIFQVVSFYLQINDIKNISVAKYSNPSEPNSRSSSNSKISLNSDLFGKYIPKNLDKANIAPSTLDIHVIGVLFSTQKAESQVILKFANGKENIFKIGDIIHGGATIVEISKDGVIISRNGVLESIKLSNYKLMFEGLPKPLH